MTSTAFCAITSSIPSARLLVNGIIGMMGSPFLGVFGNLNAALHQAFFYTARIIRFPERRGDLAKLRAELNELRRTISVR